jgi:hypothetical protein
MSDAETKTRARKPTPYSDAYILELRKVIQRTHPDKGGTAEAFHAAKERFDAAKARAAARNYRQFEDECERVMRWWPDAPPTSDEWGALMHGKWHGGRDALRRYRETKTQQAQPETKTSAATPETKTRAETKTRNRGGRPPGVSAFAAWVLETKTPRASAYRQWAAFMSATGETKTAARAGADALAKFLRWRKA